jgi:uncharacterized protein YecE (DUF72 family)
MGPRLAGGATGAGAIRIGIGGWTYAPWRSTFYPRQLARDRELDYASRQLGSIEINGTYYRLQKPESFAKWRDETPEGFVFSLKAPRFIMNRRVLAGAGEAIDRFMGSGITELKEKLGAINWQFAPTRQFDPADFEAFLKLLPNKAGGRALRHAVEVRHASFRCAAFLALVRKHGVAVVIAGDSPHPQIADRAAPFVYVRIMGTEAKRRLGYNKAKLDMWAARARAWATGAAPDGLDYIDPEPAAAQPRDVYLYVIGGAKIRNPAAAISLIERLR